MNAKRYFTITILISTTNLLLSTVELLYFDYQFSQLYNINKK